MSKAIDQVKPKQEEVKEEPKVEEVVEEPKVEEVPAEAKVVEEKPAVASTSGVNKRKVVVEYQSKYGGLYTLKVKKMKCDVYVGADYVEEQTRFVGKFSDERAKKFANPDEDMRELSEVYFADMEQSVQPTFDEEIEEVEDAGSDQEAECSD